MKFNLSLENIKYIKISYKDLDNDPCTVKAAIKKMDDREIIACAKFDEDLELKTPQEIVLSIVCNEGLYKTKTLLKKIENDAPYIFFIIAPPEGLEYLQNREYFRVKGEYNCIYNVVKNNEIKRIPCKTKNISANGVSIELPSHIMSEEDSVLEISIGGNTVTPKARYVRSEKHGSNYLLSFTYIQISEADRDIISKTCIQKQLEQKRNSIL